MISFCLSALVVKEEIFGYFNLKKLLSSNLTFSHGGLPNIISYFPILTPVAWLYILPSSKHFVLSSKEFISFIKGLPRMRFTKVEQSSEYKDKSCLQIINAIGSISIPYIPLNNLSTCCLLIVNLFLTNLM